MERWNRRPVVVTLLASALATATIATTAWLGMQWILRQDVRDSAQARTVIAVFELRAEAERFMGRARAFLLSGDDAVLHRFDADRAAFRTSLDRIASRERSSAKELAPVRAAADEYSAVLDAAIPARRTAPNDEVSLSYETRLRSLRARLDAAFDDLIEREEAQLHSREGSTRQTAASIAARPRSHWAHSRSPWRSAYGWQGPSSLSPRSVSSSRKRSCASRRPTGTWKPSPDAPRTTYGGRSPQFCSSPRGSSCRVERPPWSAPPDASAAAPNGPARWSRVC